jgi:hypothetical protein
MADFIETLKTAGILEENHGYANEEAIAADLVNHLKSRIQMEAELKELKANPPAAAAPTPEPEPTPEPAPTRTAPASFASPEIDQGQLEYANYLKNHGKITGDANSGFAAVDSMHSVQADLLNRQVAIESEQQARLMQTLVNSPDKFANEYLGDHITKMIDDAVNKATEPLKEQITSQEGQFVRAPDAREEYFFSHQDDTDEQFTARQSQYDEIAAAIEKQFKEEGILADADPKVFEKQVHQLAATKTDLLLLNDKQTPPADGTTPAPESTAPVETPTFVEKVNSGAEIDESGIRNNGSARQLNEHAHQVGDTSQPVTTQGRVDFMALANDSAQKQGINL